MLAHKMHVFLTESFLANNFADFQYSAGKNQDFVQSLVAFGISNICFLSLIFWVKDGTACVSVGATVLQSV